MNIRPALLLLLGVIFLVSCRQDSIVKWTEEHILQSGFYQLSATHHMFPEPGGSAGAIAYINGHWLIVAGDGSFHLFDRTQAGDDFQIQPLPYQVPMNRQQFVSEALANHENKETVTPHFRVSDLALSQSGDLLTLWVSHHWWLEKEACFTLRVSSTVADEAKFLSGELTGLEWSTLYEAQPCLTVGAKGFNGLESGGKMVWTGSPPDTLFLTTGIHGFDGLDGVPDFAQDSNASWGKVLKIDLQTGSESIFTTGHRNPQGLFLDNTGQIWLTEHGPRGGDEFNRLEQGKNYGWPLVTYGTEYDTYDAWPLSETPGRHDGFEMPMFSWVPSVGISDVIRLQGDLFPRWKNDFFAVSLWDQSLYRIHMDEDRVIIVEPILVNKRLRGITEDPEGRIVLWTDNHRMIFIEPVLNPEYSE